MWGIECFATAVVGECEATDDSLAAETWIFSRAMRAPRRVALSALMAWGAVRRRATMAVGHESCGLKIILERVTFCHLSMVLVWGFRLYGSLSSLPENDESGVSLQTRISRAER